ncbi:MAG: electron transport complex subunit RsxG [Gammaproteobacteria bacterium]|nr:electron transport complex subunit RsxG [Gammaproteobacteria bacterium]MBT8110262.1 electron transport complex subunit RsxG [Gammaproteobacteria bacterium]NND48182.1 electron transport complex subunit RsxG [Woeseiaceae bacterium]NNL44965.1 electron transport complex subunit RsxG [Woeseiaceae bacterium]
MTTTMFRSGVTLAVIAAVCTALVALTYRLTAERIVANEQAWLERSLQPALSGLFYDSGVTESKIIIPPPHELPGSEAAIVYRVYAEAAPVAALFVVSARDGYAGPIRILIGIDTMGVVTGIHVLEHRETPGLGDRVESTKSDWVKQFDGRSLLDPEPTGWAIKGDGGQFDQLTGASVTPRAIIKAIKETLLYFEAHSEEIFATVIPETDKEKTEQ